LESPYSDQPVYLPPGDVYHLPTEADFRGMLAEANGAGGLDDLRRLVSAWQAVAQQCEVAFAETVRLAVYRLEVERALGFELAQTVSRGGRGSKSERELARGGASRGLPDGVSKHNAKRYRDLAAIPEGVFLSYVTYAEAKGKVPTANGARRFSASHERAVDTYPRKAGQGAITLPAAVWEAIAGFASPDVVAGAVPLAAARHIEQLDASGIDGLEGVLVAAPGADPGPVMAGIAERCDAGGIPEAIAVVRAEVWKDWFGALATDGWLCCFVREVRVDGVGVAVCYRGGRAGAFRAALAEHGWAS